MVCSVKHPCLRTTSLQRPVPQPSHSVFHHMKHLCYKTTSLQRPVPQPPHSVRSPPHMKHLCYKTISLQRPVPHRLVECTEQTPPGHPATCLIVYSGKVQSMSTTNTHLHTSPCIPVQANLCLILRRGTGMRHLCYKTTSLQKPVPQPPHSVFHYMKHLY